MNLNNSFNTSDYPGLYQTADKASVESQNNYMLGIGLYLSLLIAASVCSLFLGDSTSLAIIAALIFVATLFISILLLIKRYDKAWYNGRAVAESVKTITWRYMMHAEPYQNPNDSEARVVFVNDLRQILEQNREFDQIFTGDTATTEAISKKMIEIRALELADRQKVYINDRIDDQRAWYYRKARFNKKKGFLWFVLMCVVQAGALILVLVRIAKPTWNIYLPIDLCIVCACVALTWTQTKRFQDLSTAYSLATHEISLIREACNAAPNEKELSNFINDAENAFSREHTQWQARRHT